MSVRKIQKSDKSVLRNIEPLINKAKTSATMKFVVIAVVAILGYVAGVNHYQIEGAVAPLFGLKAHSGSINLSSLEETYNALAANYDGKLDVQKLIDGANKGLVAAAGDQYTVYMTADETSEYEKSLSGDIGGGIGVAFSIRNNVLTAIDVLDNNPAKSAGIKDGDVVTAINGDSTGDMTLDDAVQKIRGDIGTTVKLTVLRNGETKEYSITRAQVNNPSVTSEISGTIGIITISRFDSETGDLARSAATKLLNQGAKSIILDLRDNGGGYVSAAQDVAGLWLSNKTVVTEKSGSTVRETLKTDDDAILAGIPTVVLVNSATASASEIVSGALKDYGAATLVGKTTYGKGCVQELISLSGGTQIKVTVANWYTPKGKNISGNGITPDKVVDLTQSDLDNNKDHQMDAAKEVLK